MLGKNMFLRFDGILYENMSFELWRGWETSRIARRQPVGDGPYLLELLDADNSILIQVRPRVDFRDACFQSASTMRVARVTAYIPYHLATRRLVFRRDEYVIYDTPVAKDPPHVEIDNVIHHGKSVSVSWKASHSENIPLTFNIFCKIDQERRFVMLARDLDEYEAKLSLEKVPGGEGRLILLATDGLRSSYDISDAFQVTHKSPEIWITSPREGAAFPPDQPFSLIGQAVDILGSKLPEEGLVWEVDGRTLQQGTGITPAIGLKPCNHEASLSLQSSDGVIARSTVTFTITEYNEAQLRYRQVMGLDS